MGIDTWLIDGVYLATVNLGWWVLAGGSALAVGFMLGYAFAKVRFTKKLS